MRHSKGLPRVAIATALVFAVSASLWFAAPVQALDITFPSLPSSGTLGSDYSFTAEVSIADTELLPIQSVDLYIYKSDNRATYEATSADLPLGTTTTPYTTITATGSSGTCGTVSITATAGAAWAYGYGYGYTQWEGYGYYFFSPGGYGYGYGYGPGATSITYNVTWTSPGDWPEGQYKAEIKLTANGETFTKTRSVTLSEPEEEAPPAKEEEITGEVLLDEAEQDIEAAGDALHDAAEQDIEAAGDALQDAAEQDAEIAGDILGGVAEDNPEIAGDLLREVAEDNPEIAGVILGEVAEDNPEIAGVILGEVAEDNPEIAGDLLEEVAEDNPGLAGDILENTDAEQAAAAMEQTDIDTLNEVIPEMSEESLTERLPEMSADKLGDIDVQTLFDALPNAPTEQLAGEITPEALEGLPDIVRVTANGEEYLAIRSEEDGWVIIAATPAPVDQLMIKTKQAIENIKTLVEIFDERPFEITVGLPAEQIVRAYIKITLENITPADIEAGHITFYVEKDWLEQNSIHKWSVFLNRYDPELGQWIALPTKRVDEDDTKVYYTSVITHFSVFAISGSETLPPVNFEVANLVIDPAEAETGEDITISASVTSVSDEDNTYVATLWIDKTVETAIDIYLQAGETKPVSFIVTRDAEGIYEVRVDRLFSSFSVTEAPPVPVTPVIPAPAEFAITDLSVSPAEVETGQTVTISALVTNIGEEEGSYWVTLNIDGIPIDIQPVTLKGGASQKVTFTTSRDAAGTYTVSIAELSGTFTVEEAVEEVPPEEVPIVPVKAIVNWWPIGGIIAGVVITSIIIWLVIRWRRRRYSIL